MSSIIAVDPGPTDSALVHLTDGAPIEAWHGTNEAILDRLDADTDGSMLAIEMIASYGMAVGASVFDTCVWIGRFVQRWTDNTGRGPLLVYRKDVKLHLCGSSRAKDTNIRQAIVDRYGPSKAVAVGLKASPGPLYGVKSHAWAALGVALTVYDGAAGEAA